MKEIKTKLSSKEILNKQKERQKAEYQVAAQLAKEKKYEEIFALYGRDTYLNFAPKKYKKKEIKKLLREGKFEDIYIKYGPIMYGKYLPKMEAIDIYLETGKKGKGLLRKLNYKIKETVLPAFISGVVFFEGLPFLLLAVSTDKVIEENAIKYAEDISSYDRKIKEYAKQFQNPNLTDLQVIMKVMKDMWDSIAGYGNPQKNIIGFQRLDFLEENGIGVCRNMADDVSAKLNAINPKYNARTLAVKMDMEKGVKLNKIGNSKRPPSNNEENNNYAVPNEDSLFTKFSVELVGNHKVVLVDIPEENITLVVDPTNPGIGVFRYGKIYMFSVPDGEVLTVRHYSTFVDGTLSIFDYNKRKIDSFFDSNISIEELERKYGVEAQNKALDYILSLENKKINKENENYGNNSYVEEREHTFTKTR